MTETFSKRRPIFFDLSERAKFRISGSDCQRFLNGQITNDLRKAREMEAIEACVLNTKGRIDAHLFIVGAANSYLLDADRDLRTAIPARLDRYIIADDVQVDDVSDEFALFHCLASDLTELPNEWKMVRSVRFSAPGWDVWAKKSEHNSLLEVLSKNATLCDADCAEIFRIECGLPRWGRELTAEIIPIEANLEQRCVDYAKGCYIGQEVISRMKMSGQTNKRLCGLVARDGVALLPSARLQAGEEKRDAGWITSAGYSSRLGKNIGLGFVKRGFNLEGTALYAEPALDVQVVGLPFS